jgi:YidC/Oxa1 family membrane protein insertase
MEWGFFEVFAAGLAGFYALVKSYGLAIILLTVAIRILLLPLSIKQTRSMREMAVIQPEVKKLQAKHKGDRQKLNEEMMKLYKEHGVNPLGGCLPLLMQFPVLIALFHVIRTPLDYMDQNWGLANDLTDNALRINSFLSLRLDCYPSDVLGSEPSSTISTACGSGFVSFIPYLLLILAMGFTTYYSQKQLQAQRGNMDNNPQAQQMQMFTRIMPILLMVLSFNFATGLLVYWLTTNLWTIVQQRIILKAAPLPPASGGKPKASGAAAIEAKAKKADPAKPAGKARPVAGGKSSGKPNEAAGNGAAGTPGSSAAKSRPHPSSKKKKRR